MAFEDPLRAAHILKELREQIRGKTFLPLGRWLAGDAPLKDAVAFLEQSRDGSLVKFAQKCFTRMSGLKRT
jgi:hypothetical protein